MVGKVERGGGKGVKGGGGKATKIAGMSARFWTLGSGAQVSRFGSAMLPRIQKAFGRNSESLRTNALPHSTNSSNSLLAHRLNRPDELLPPSSVARDRKEVLRPPTPSHGHQQLEPRVLQAGGEGGFEVGGGEEVGEHSGGGGLGGEEDEVGEVNCGLVHINVEPVVWKVATDDKVRNG